MYHLRHNLSNDVSSFYDITVVTVPLKSLILCKAMSVQAYCKSVGFQGVDASKFLDSGHLKVVRSAQRAGRLYPSGNIPGTHFC
jgi:hypothetical protein